MTTKIFIKESENNLYKIYRVFTLQKLIILDILTKNGLNTLNKSEKKFTSLENENKTIISDYIDKGYELIDISDSLTPHFDLGKYDKHYGTIDNKNTRRNRL